MTGNECVQMNLQGGVVLNAAAHSPFLRLAIVFGVEEACALDLLAEGKIKSITNVEGQETKLFDTRLVSGYSKFMVEVTQIGPDGKRVPIKQEPTGAEIYLEEKKEDPSYKKAYEAAKEKLATSPGESASDDDSVKQKVQKTASTVKKKLTPKE